MLVVSRKAEQSIFIAENIRVKVLSIRGGTIRLGIEAPPDIRVLRDEHLAGGDEPKKGQLTVQRRHPRFAA